MNFIKGTGIIVCLKFVLCFWPDGLNDDVILDFIIKENDTRGNIPFNELMSCFKSAKKYN